MRCVCEGESPCRYFGWRSAHLYPAEQLITVCVCTLSGTGVEERFHWASSVQVSLLEWADQTSAVSLIICMLHGCERLFTRLLFPCTGQLYIDLSVLNSLSSSHRYLCFLTLQYVCYSLCIFSGRFLGSYSAKWSTYKSSCLHLLIVEAFTIMLVGKHLVPSSLHLAFGISVLTWSTFEAKPSLIFVHRVTALKMHEPTMLRGS